MKAILSIVLLISSGLVSAQSMLEFSHPVEKTQIKDCETVASVLNATRAVRPGDYAVLSAVCDENVLTVKSAGLKPARRAIFDLLFMKSDLSCQDSVELVKVVNALRSTNGSISGNIDCDAAVMTRRFTFKVVRLQ